MQHLHCNSDVTIGAHPSLVFFVAQSVCKLDSSSAAMLVISSSEANSSFSHFLCSALLLRYSSRFSLFTSLSSVLTNVLSTLSVYLIRGPRWSSKKNLSSATLIFDMASADATPNSCFPSFRPFQFL